ncbi:hypothetical protein WICMUC_001516 [Wickerhamomyces mucosus]|uniref:Zinc/cadmium resistance protein n=1 Tax=Wickerhamomyces mucosus TaxID=1378264 RepID=A0A9P8TH16_9ASCO|nr:hypothetical protein WICMUC_001516 [Wickerhamomyces mucosus]
MALSNKEIRITILLVIDTIFFLLEAIVGYAVHSLALVADSFHMLNDIFSLLVALWAVRVATSKNADAKYTYGWKRAEILGALINAVFLLALCFSILIEAIQRLISPEVITNPKLILVVGTAGLISNIVGLFLFHDHGHSHGGNGGHGHSHSEAIDDDQPVEELLPQNVVNSYNETTALLSKSSNTTHSPYSHEPLVTNDYHTTPSSHSHEHTHDSDDHEHGHEHGHDHGHSHTLDSDDLESQTFKSKQKKKTKSLNMHGVFLHVLGDALGNVGVMLTAIFIWKTDYSWKYYSDPVISLIITAIIFSSALPLCKRASRILLQATPSTISADDIQIEILEIKGIKSVHDFHIWNLTEDIFIASLHVEVDANPEKFLVIASEIRSILHGHGVHSVTVQPEFSKNNISLETYQQFTENYKNSD